MCERSSFKDIMNRIITNHPKVQGQLRRIQELKRQVVAQQEESAELRSARAELVELQRRYEDQVRRVGELERRAKQRTESAELQAARERFAKVKQKYHERHPKYQVELRRMQELEKQQPSTNETAEQNH